MQPTLRHYLAPFLGTPERVNLWFFLTIIIAGFGCLGKLLVPVFVAMVIAYLLQWPLLLLQNYLRLPRVAAVLLVYSAFMSLIIGLCILIIPLLLAQIRHLITELPNMATQSQQLLLELTERYPSYVSAEHIQSLTTEARLALTRLGQWAFSTSLNSLSNIMTLAIYLVLVPLLLYFFLMDQHKILNWISGCLPEKRRLIREVWEEVYTQTGNYVRGKALEIMIVWLVSASIFAWMGLPYAMLLGLLVGLASIIPYIGTIIVTVPIVIIASLEWGWSRELAYLLGAYALINVLDANILVPVLFAETVSLHPVAIMVSILIFGGLLGFWGIFFAIPLAVLVKALLKVLRFQEITPD